MALSRRRCGQLSPRDGCSRGDVAKSTTKQEVTNASQLAAGLEDEITGSRKYLRRCLTYVLRRGWARLVGGGFMTKMAISLFSTTSAIAILAWACGDDSTSGGGGPLPDAGSATPSHLPPAPPSSTDAA